MFRSLSQTALAQQWLFISGQCYPLNPAFEREDLKPFQIHTLPQPDDFKWQQYYASLHGWNQSGSNKDSNLTNQEKVSRTT